MEKSKKSRYVVRTLKSLDRNKVVQFKQIHVDRLIKLKKFAGSFTGIGPGLDKNGTPSTGLSEDFREDGVKNTALSTGTRIGMEQLMELPEGSLKPTSPYWTQFYVRMDSETIDLDLSDDTDLLKYLFLLGQSIVANGLEEAENNADAEFVIYSKEQEAKNRVDSRSALKEAYRLSDKLDNETKLQILSVYGINADASQTNIITDKIDEKLEEDPEKFLKLAADSNLVVKSLFSRCLDKGIITAKDGSFFHNEVPLGFDKESAVVAIANNIQLTAVLKAKLSGDMDLIQEALNPSKE